MKLMAMLTLLFASSALADIVVPMSLVNEQGIGESAGNIRITESKYGVVLTASLKGLTPGLHGFHLHQNASCEAKEKDGKKEPAGAAGGHFDPANTAQHGTPWGRGHLGDLPPLYVSADGSAAQPVLAPRLTLKELTGHSLIIHAGGDNHADQPEKLGGGGARVACGVIQ